MVTGSTQGERGLVMTATVGFVTWIWSSTMFFLLPYFWFLWSCSRSVSLFCQGPSENVMACFTGQNVVFYESFGRYIYDNVLSEEQRKQAFQGWRPNNMKATVEICKHFIIVAGLLTTSTYSAIYTSLPTSSGLSSLKPWGEVAFRSANVLSFLTSILSIVISFFIVLLLTVHTALREQKVDAGEALSPVRPWAVGFTHWMYHTAFAALLISLYSTCFGVFVASALFNAFVGAWLAVAIILAVVLLSFSSYISLHVLTHVGIYENDAPKDKEDILDVVIERDGRVIVVSMEEDENVEEFCRDYGVTVSAFTTRNHLHPAVVKYLAGLQNDGAADLAAAAGGAARQDLED